jgi:hypothetical protein
MAAVTMWPGGRWRSEAGALRWNEAGSSSAEGFGRCFSGGVVWLDASMYVRTVWCMGNAESRDTDKE